MLVVGEENSGDVALESYHYSKTNAGVEVRKSHRQIRETIKEDRERFCEPGETNRVPG